MPEDEKTRVNAAISLYSRYVLFHYDWFILGINCRFLWGCPSGRILDLYNRHVSANHLDVGVGTGYFMDKCRFPSAAPRLALMDLSPNSLRSAAKRLERYRPEVYQRNVLEGFPKDIPRFDSVALTNLLHCLPGNMSTKAAVIEYAQGILNPGGWLFGSTILFRGVTRNALTTAVLKRTNRAGYMTNLDDDVATLQESLQENFETSTVEIVGCMALFRARKGA